MSETALTLAAIEKFGQKAVLFAEYSEASAELNLFRVWQVVTKVKSPHKEIDLQTARKNFDTMAEIGDEFAVQIEHKTLGRKTARYFDILLSQAQNDGERKNIPAALESDQINQPSSISAASPDHVTAELESNLSAEIYQDSFTADYEFKVPCRQDKEYFPFQSGNQIYSRTRFSATC